MREQSRGLKKGQFVNYSIEDMKRIINIAVHLGGHAVSYFDNVAQFKFKSDRHAQAAHVLMKHQGFHPSREAGSDEVLVVV